MITHLHLVLRLKMRGVIPAVCLYTFIAWRGTTLPFYQRSKHIYQFWLFTQTGMETRRHWICGHSFKIKQCTHLHQSGLFCQIRTRQWSTNMTQKYFTQCDFLSENKFPLLPKSTKVYKETPSRSIYLNYECQVHSFFLITEQ